MPSISHIKKCDDVIFFSFLYQNVTFTFSFPDANGRSNVDIADIRPIFCLLKNADRRERDELRNETGGTDDGYSDIFTRSEYYIVLTLFSSKKSLSNAVFLIPLQTHSDGKENA